MNAAQRKNASRCPDAVAKTLRTLCLGDITCGNMHVGHVFYLPRTWHEYFTMPRGFDRMDAYKAVDHVRLHARCDTAAALSAVEAVLPELFAEYWETLPYDMKGELL